MNVNLIFFAIVPFILMCLISIGMPFWRIRLMKEAGDKLLTFVRKPVKLQFFAIPAAYLLLILSNLIDFGKLSFVIPYCAVLALFITIKESTLLPVNGLYEKLLINSTDVIKLENITGLLESDAGTPTNVLKINTKQGTRSLTFDNSNEVEEVRKILNERIKK